MNSGDVPKYVNNVLILQVYVDNYRPQIMLMIWIKSG